MFWKEGLKMSEVEVSRRNMRKGSNPPEDQYLKAC